MARLGEASLILAAAAAPLLLSPRPRAERRWLLPLLVATAVTVLFVLGLIFRFDLIQASALYGLRMEVPPGGSIAGVGYVIALFGWAYATTELCADKGGMRLTGYGLGLLALGGYDAGSPVELSLSLLGLLALAVGELRAAPYADRTRPRVSSVEWKDFVGRLAGAAGDGTEPDDTPPEAIVVEEEELEVSRIRTHRRGHPDRHQAPAAARRLGRARYDRRPLGPRSAERQHRAPPPLAGAQPREPIEAHPRQDR